MSLSSFLFLIYEIKIKDEDVQKPKIPLLLRPSKSSIASYPAHSSHTPLLAHIQDAVYHQASCGGCWSIFTSFGLATVITTYLLMESKSREVLHLELAPPLWLNVVLRHPLLQVGEVVDEIILVRVCLEPKAPATAIATVKTKAAAAAGGGRCSRLVRLGHKAIEAQRPCAVGVEESVVAGRVHQHWYGCGQARTMLPTKQAASGQQCLAAVAWVEVKL